MGRLGILLFFVVCLSCESRPKHETSQAAQTWSGGMQNVSRELRTLIPYVFSSSQFSDPSQRPKISKALAEFSNSVHKIPSAAGESRFGGDPLFQFSLEHLKRETRRASSAFQAGRVEYARDLSKSVMNHCFRCHSLVKAGSGERIRFDAFTGVKLNAVEKVEFLVAVRSFRQAFEVLRQSLLNFEFASERPFEFESLLKKYVALSVRQTEIQSVKSAANLLEQVEASKQVPSYLKDQIASWKQSFSDWDSLGKTASGPSLSRARRMITRGRDLQSYYKDHSGDVEYLRAAEELHGSFVSGMQKGDRPKAYLLLGEVYEVLDELGYWGLHESYYETCVRAYPKTKVARVCYHRLRNSLYLGFSGSSGVHLPESEKQRLKNLESMMN